MLPSPDPTLLTAIVRQDQRDPHFELLDWEVELLSDKGIINPGGLFRIHGTGRCPAASDASPWSVVLKTVTAKPEQQDPHHMSYWKREMLAVQSGLLANLPGPLMAPRVYGVSDDAPGGWIWMEHVHPTTPPRWTVDHFRFAAHQLGRFNGAYLTHSSSAGSTPLPDFPWLCRDHARTWIDGNQPPEITFENPLIRAHFGDLRAGMARLWDEKERFLAVLAGLPRTFSHFDFHRRNLIIRTVDQRPQLVAVDWAMCGLGPAGADLSSLIGLSALLAEVQPTDISTLHRLAFDDYLSGLRAAGWSGDPRLIRLAYITWFALYFGAETGWTLMWTATEAARQLALRQFGRPLDELAAGWAALCRFALLCADEARAMM